MASESSPVPTLRPTIREILLAQGVSEKKVRATIRRKLFRWPAIVLDDFRLFLGGDPYTAEWTFVRDFSHCRSWADVEEALFEYRNNPLRSRSWVWRTLGGTPNALRARWLYRRLQLPPNRRPAP